MGDKEVGTRPDQPSATVTGPAVTGEEDLDDADADPLLASNPEGITD